MNGDFNSEYRFGSASWASEQDIWSAGLFGERGLHLGFWKGRELRYDGDASVLVFGGAGSGKLRDFLAYNLCRSPGLPMLSLDPRGELAAISLAAHTFHGEYAYCWNPAGTAGLPQHRCNPLDIIDPSSPHFHGDCKFTAEAIVVSTGSANAHYFETRARGWLSDFLVSLACRHGHVSFPMIYRLINAIEADPAAWADHAEYMLASPFDNVRRTAAEVLAKQADSPKEFGSIMGELHGSLTWLDDPTLLQSLEGGDFSLGELCRTDPVRKIFLNPPAEYLSLWAPLLRCFFTTAMLYKSRHPAARRVTLIADESGQLGRFEALLRAFTFGRGAGLRAVALFQDRGQVVRSFTESGLRSFEGSAQATVAFGIRDFQSSSDISNRLGNETLQYNDARAQETARRQQWLAFQRFMTDGDPVSSGYDYQHYGETAELRSRQARRLMTPDEILAMREDQALIFLSGKGIRPIMAEKYPYFSQASMAGYYLANPYHPPVTHVPIATRWGTRWAKVVTERVPTRFSHFPQYQSGEWSFVEGYRP
jgi:type IV secretion system protein VirD4